MTITEPATPLQALAQADLRLQLQRLFEILLLRQHNALRRPARPLADLG